MLRQGRADPLPLWRWLATNHHSELCMEWKNMKISESLSKSKYMVFNIKKLLNVGVDLILRRKGEKK
jgi:hypothetical protein